MTPCIVRPFVFQSDNPENRPTASSTCPCRTSAGPCCASARPASYEKSIGSRPSPDDWVHLRVQFGGGRLQALREPRQRAAARPRDCSPSKPRAAWRCGSATIPADRSGTCKGVTRSDDRRRISSLARRSRVHWALASRPPRRASQRVRRDWIPGTEVLEEIPASCSLAGLPGLTHGRARSRRPAWQHTVRASPTRRPRHPLHADTLVRRRIHVQARLRVRRTAARRAAAVIDLDRPLALYHRPAYLPADARLDRVTARHVLTHTSGCATGRGRQRRNFPAPVRSRRAHVSIPEKDSSGCSSSSRNSPARGWMPSCANCCSNPPA